MTEKEKEKWEYIVEIIETICTTIFAIVALIVFFVL